MKTAWTIALLAAATLTGTACEAYARDAPSVESLFDGRTLDGWVQRGGEAHYAVQDGVIVGTTVPRTPNSFLCTKRRFGDFELWLEFLVDPKLNSGIQVRSESSPEYRNGRVHGYQVEIDPSERAWTAGIYDEARRGWLYPLEGHPAAQKAFLAGRWNRLRVLAIGDSIRTWLNGVPAADLIDAMTLSGFIGLQVHASHEQEPQRIRWRNIRIRDLGRHVWVPLFDGRAPAGWETPPDRWSVRDGCLRATGTSNDLLDAPLRHKRLLRDFVVRLRCQPNGGAAGLGFGSPTRPDRGCYVKIATPEQTGGLWRADGSQVAPPNVEKKIRPAKEGWITLTVSVHGPRIVTSVDGRQAVDVTLDQPLPAGPLLLLAAPDGAADVRFRDIELLVPMPRGPRPPAGAIPLLGAGGDLSAWQPSDPKKPAVGWKFAEGVLTVVPHSGSIMSRRSFGDMFLHVEFCPNDNPAGKWQGNGNSGVYIQRRYEVQVLNSFGRELNARDCGAIYGIKAPDVAVCRPAGQWQSYDIAFRAARWDAGGSKTADARITVYQNGVQIHDDVAVAHQTGAGNPEAPAAAPLLLQDHGNAVRFRNIWVLPIEPGLPPTRP